MTERLRIAFIGQRSIPADYGGVEVFAEEVGARLVERGHEVTAFCAEEGASGTAQHRGVTIEYVPTRHGKHTRALSQTFSSSIRCLGSRFDVVHYMAMGPTISSPLVRFGSTAGVVATIAGRDDQRAKWSWPARIAMKASLETLRRIPHRVMPVSMELYDDFLPYVGDRLRRVPNGIAVPEPMTDTARLVESMGIRPGRYVLCAGRLVPEKRLLDLIDAFRQTTSDHHLVIAGGGGAAGIHESQLRAAAAGDDRIVFLGHRSSIEVDALQRHASLFALVSDLEGLPFALLEAAARGAPLLVSDLSCNLEVVGVPDRGATVVAVGDVEAIRDGITRMLDDPGAREAARTRSASVLTRFAWEPVIDQILGVYREAVVAAGRPALRSDRTVIDLSDVPTRSTSADDQSPVEHMPVAKANESGW